MKKKFIIVDTWNGEGYSDSSHEIIEANNINEVHDYCMGRAQECISIDDGALEDNKGESYGHVSYQIDDDYGCIHWRYLSEDAIAVCLNPIVNEYWMVESQIDLQEMMNLIEENSEEDFEDEAIIGGYHHNGLGDGDLTIQLIDSDIDKSISHTEDTPSIYNGEGIVFYDSGDGVEYEVWQDEKTDKLYRVPIEVVRDFSDMEEVSSCHEAKFGK